MISDSNSVILSEPASSNEKILSSIGLSETEFNIVSIFIWNENTVYRLVCVQHIDMPKTYFNKWQSTDNIKYFLDSVFLYKDEKYLEIDPLINFAKLVNKYSNNNLLTVTYTSHGSYLKRIKKTKIVPHFLPIMFNNPESKEEIWLSPFYINYYSKENNTENQKLFNYILKNTIYIPDGILSGLNQIPFDNNQLLNTMENSSLYNLFSLEDKSTISKDATDFFSEYELKEQKFNLIDSFGIIHKLLPHCQSKYLFSHIENTCSNLLMCNSEYEYDNFCYNPMQNKSFRMYYHCPFNINGGSYSYVEMYNKFVILKAENKNLHCNNPPWYLFIPGIGYWMANVRTDDKEQYFIPDFKSTLFKVNNHSIYDFLMSN